MNNLYYKTKHINLSKLDWYDFDEVKEIINDYKDEFFCPFSNKESYLNIYEGRDCEVQFFNLHSCDYSKEPNKAGKVYIKYLSRVEKKIGNRDKSEFLDENYDKFSVETNEENFDIVEHKDERIKKLLDVLHSMWRFDASKNKGRVCRARFVRLPAGGVMPFHRDETSSENLRMICPIITNEDCLNAFKDEEGDLVETHFPATGAFYTFNENKIEHAVFNKSNEDRYALIFTVTNIDDIKEWDRGYYRNKMYWKNWGHM